MDDSERNEIGRDMGQRLAANIKMLEDRRRREERQAPVGDRIARAITNFTGSMTFVVLEVPE